ncbi:protein toll-like [Lucilia sericata]|uniref:protein toll-like n=1 Tax=Lucilia sericata TaxID=13632 RepID=UPI0018A83AF5|nr:protein toll-like [Lucilia sericata]
MWSWILVIEPADIFRHQTKLIELSLRNNKLTNLTENLFYYSSTLKSLDLENNLIEVLQPDIFKPLINLIRLNLSSNKLIALPQGLLDNNKNLIELSLGHNQVQMKNLPSNLLANLPHLYEVLLECGLEELPPTIFHNSKNILSLTITGNKFTELPEDLFKSQQHLKFLNISNNNLLHLPETFLQNTTDLQIFDVSYNNLTLFSSNMFHSCRELEVLLLNNNKLTTDNIHITWTFRFHRNLKTLNMSNNLIESVSKEWTVPYFLEIFDLSHNKITILSDTEIINLLIYKIILLKIRTFKGSF